MAVLPGLVNAHTHLELSYLHDRIPPARRFLDWVRPMLAARAERAHPGEAAILDAARKAIQDARAAGTSLIGDVTNTLAAVPLLRDAQMPACVFHELLGFAGQNADAQVGSARTAIDAIAAHDDIRSSLAPHAPYSVSPALFGAIRRDLDEHGSAVSTVHLGESPEEVEFLLKGTGPWRTLLEQIGVWNADWQAPKCSPVDYLADMGFLTGSVLAVHGVQFEGIDLDRLRTLGVTLVSCPRSNRYVGVGSPPLEAFYAMDVEVAFGTDSLASVDDLNMFGELAEARRIAPKVPARALLRSATLTGATALGFGDRVRQHRARQARGAHRRARAGSRDRCGRIPGVRSRVRPHLLGRGRMNKLATYLSFVRFSHSVFALPFALTGALLAWREQPFSWLQVAWIVVCMVSARSAAMGFNRLVDAKMDALNPRTAMRELPRGLLSKPEATAFVIVASAVFVFAASRLSPLCLVLAPVALAIVFWYSLAKRFTTYTQMFLGLALAVAPVGGWIAAGGRGGAEPWLLGLAIGLWVGGFDILYACQDVDFDRRHGLRSIPATYGVPASIRLSRVMHLATVDRDGVAVVGGESSGALSRWRRDCGRAAGVRAVARQR